MNDTAKKKAADKKPAATPRKKREGEPALDGIAFSTPSTLEEAATAWGGSVVLALANASMRLQLSEFVRKLKASTPTPTPEAVQAAVTNWKPEVKRRGKPVTEKFEKFAAGMTLEDKKALLAKLQAEMGSNINEA